MKRCTTLLELPRRGTEFTIKLPAHGVIRDAFCKPVMPNVLLVKQGEEPQPDFVPMILVEFNPDDTWIPRQFVTVPIGTVVENRELELHFAAIMIHPMAGPFVMFEARRPNGGCLACGVMDGVAHEATCLIAYPKLDRPVLESLPAEQKFDTTEVES
jgi:hypothetical protein